jgi:hypothetical protein
MAHGGLVALPETGCMAVGRLYIRPIWKYGAMLRTATFHLTLPIPGVAYEVPWVAPFGAPEPIGPEMDSRARLLFGRQR